MPHPRRNRSCVRLEVTSLEGRELLSGFGPAPAAGDGRVAATLAPPGGHADEVRVNHVYAILLHRRPGPEEYSRGRAAIRRGVGFEQLSLRVIASREFRAASMGVHGFVQTLDGRVLGGTSDEATLRRDAARLARGAVTPLGLAREYLGHDRSFLRSVYFGLPGSGGIGGGAPGSPPPMSGLPGSIPGSISNVSSNRGTTGVTGSTINWGLSFNRGDTTPARIQFNVGAAGQYTLAQTQAGVYNSSGRSWPGYTVTIVAPSSAGVTFSTASSTGGPLAQASVAPTRVTFTGQAVPINGTLRITTVIRTTGPALVVIQQMPS